MSFFGGVPYDQGPNELYNRHANFKSFFTSCITLFRMATGESWNGIMHDVMALGGAYEWAWLYFCSYIVIGAYMILNLLIAIVLETFQRVMKLEEAIVKPLHVTGFLEVWTAFDPEQFSFIDAVQLKEFLRRLEEPLWPAGPGLGPTAKRADMAALIAETPVTSDGKVHLVELFVTLMKEAYGRQEIEDIEPKALKQVLADLVGQYPTIYRNDLAKFDKGRDKGSDMANWLESQHINPVDAYAYASLMIDRGIDQASDLSELSQPDLDIFGMKHMHKKKVWQAIKHMRERNRQDELLAMLRDEPNKLTPRTMKRASKVVDDDQAKWLWRTFSHLEEREAMKVLDECTDTTRSNFAMAIRGLHAAGPGVGHGVEGRPLIEEAPGKEGAQ